MQPPAPLHPLLALLALLASCSSKTEGSTADAGMLLDAGDTRPMDAGAPPCVRDEDCAVAEVCNLSGEKGVCVAGHPCATDDDCKPCAALDHPIDCGHGFHLNAYCAEDHVCVRARATCEICDNDRQCGTLHPDLGVDTPAKCLRYDATHQYCGRPPFSGHCPAGFVVDATSGQCKRILGCAEPPVICPRGDTDQTCTGTDQICGSTKCPGSDARCATNDLPGELGLCMGLCTADRDCPTDHPFCNRGNGICVEGCKAGACPAGNQVCQVNGFCGGPCDSNENCATRFGAGFYCNLRSQRTAPTAYKNNRDENSCAPLGCESNDDCTAGSICDPTRSPPECVRGCFDSHHDCAPGDLCKSTGGHPSQVSYDRATCRALATKTDTQELGVCCSPGCLDRAVDCGAGNLWCCGEEGSPFAESASCGQIFSEGPARKAEAGECFPVQPGSAFCKACQQSNDCHSNWTPGFNHDPAINGGQPFQEQEFCFDRLCSVTCNPHSNVADTGCPTGWNCGPLIVPCKVQTDCGPGLVCEGASASAFGRCRCGTNGQANAICPGSYSLIGDVTHPRCVGLGTVGDLYCVASYQCSPPTDRMRFPPNCPAP